MYCFCTKFYIFSISQFRLAIFQMLSSHLGLVDSLGLELLMSMHAQPAHGHHQERATSHLFMKGICITISSPAVCKSLQDPTVSNSNSFRSASLTPPTPRITVIVPTDNRRSGAYKKEFFLVEQSLCLWPPTCG